MKTHRLVVLGVLCLAVLVTSAGVRATGTANDSAQVALPDIDVWNLRVLYKADNINLLDALTSLSAAARVPICLENKVDWFTFPEKPAMPRVTVARVATLGEAINSIMSQAPDYELFWNSQLGYLHVVRKDLLKDPDWLPNRVMDRIVKVDTLGSLMELIQREKLGLKGADQQKFALLFACSGQCPWNDAVKKQQIALKVEKIVLRDLLDEMGRQLGLAGWTYGLTRNKDDSPVYGFLSFYPAADPLSLPPEYRAYYTRGIVPK